MTFVDENLSPVYQGKWEYNGVQYPSSIFTLYDETQLRKVGLHRVEIQDSPVPEDMHISGYDYIRQNNKVIGVPRFEPDPVPGQVSAAQGQAVLFQYGYYQAILEYINNLPEQERILADIAFNKTTYYSRNSPFLAKVAKTLGLSNAQLDQLFRDASKLIL